MRAVEIEMKHDSYILPPEKIAANWGDLQHDFLKKKPAFDWLVFL
ncbi:hypothetical protein [Peribacillus butanolivorans]